MHANYDPDGRLLAESAATGVADREYIWLPLDVAGAGEQAWALPLALVTDAGTSGPRIHYLHTDQLGTPVAMTSGGLGQLEWSAVLRPFGEVETITGHQAVIPSPGSAGLARRARRPAGVWVLTRR